MLPWERKTVQEVIPQTSLEFTLGHDENNVVTATFGGDRMVLRELEYHLKKAGITIPEPLNVRARIAISMKITGDDNIEKLLGILEKLPVEPRSLKLPPLKKRDVYSADAIRTSDISIEEIRAYDTQNTPKLAYVRTHLALAKKDKSVAEASAPAGDAHGAYAIAAEGGSGGGYTDENPGPNNSRTSNEDRAIAASAPLMGDTQATAFLTNTFNEHVIPATRKMLGGSTLSMAMHTSDGRIAVGTTGDSPVFIIMRQRQTGDILLAQVSIPHSRAGAELVKAARKDSAGDDVPLPKIHALVTYLAAAAKSAPDIAEKFKKGELSKNLVSGLGRMEAGEVDHTTDRFIIDPATILPASQYEYLATMVCSDGVQGVKQSVIRQQLKALYDTGTPVPQEIAEAVVKVAAPKTHDNVTVMVLPAGQAGLIAVADGNNKTAAVAEMAINKVREACRQQVLRSGNDQGEGHGGGQDVRRGTR